MSWGFFSWLKLWAIRVLLLNKVSQQGESGSHQPGLLETMWIFSRVFPGLSLGDMGTFVPKYTSICCQPTHIFGRVVIFWLGNVLSCVSFQELCTAQCLYFWFHVWRFCFYLRAHHLKRTSHPNFSSTFPQQGTDPPNLSAKYWYFLEIWTVPKASQKPYILPENWQFKPWKWMVGRRFFSVWDTAYFQRQAVGFRECIFVQCPITLATWKTCLYWDAIVIAIITTKMHRQETPPRSI